MIKICMALLLFTVSVCGATSIDIYYPNNNTTTEIYYAADGGYNTTLTNNITGDFSCIVVRNEIEYDNVIDSPHKIISPIFSLIMIVILISFIIFVVRLSKYIWSNK